MDPTQLSRSHELLRAQRPANEDVSVWNLFRNAVIVLQLHKLMAGETLLQALAYPRGRVPEFKAVVMDDKGLHFCRFAPNRSMNLPPFMMFSILVNLSPSSRSAAQNRACPTRLAKYPAKTLPDAASFFARFHLPR